MKKRIVFGFMAILFSIAWVMSSESFARVTIDPDCTKRAKSDLQTCISDCRESFQVSKDSCRNIDHDCAEDCRTEYDGCVSPILTDLGADLATCQAALDDARAACRVAFESGTANRDTCIDQAQVVAFTCRDGFREESQPALAACRVAFKGCILACPPANP
jgi:hypothetical protein